MAVRRADTDVTAARCPEPIGAPTLISSSSLCKRPMLPALLEPHLTHGGLRFRGLVRGHKAEVRFSPSSVPLIAARSRRETGSRGSTWNST